MIIILQVANEILASFPVLRNLLNLSFCYKRDGARGVTSIVTYINVFLSVFLAVTVLVTLIVLLIGNGPAVPGSVRITGSTEVAGVEDAIVTALRGPRTWRRP